MARSTIFTTTKLEKIKPSPSLQRRNSTGGAAAIFSQPNPIPNYLRASIGSCHDLCKYGSKRGSPHEESCKHINMRPEAKSSTTNRVIKKVPEPKNIVLASSRRKPIDNIVIPASSRRKPSDITSKSTCNINARAIRNVPEGKKPGSLPRPAQEPSVKIPVSKIRRTNSVPRKVLKSEPRKVLESSESCKNAECETVTEKTMDVVEGDGRGKDEGLVSEQEIDSAADNLPHDDPKEEVEEEVVERESNEEVVDDWKERRLRRVVSAGDVDLDEKEKERLRLIVISKNKVKALVSSFETLITK